MKFKNTEKKGVQKKPAVPAKKLVKKDTKKEELKEIITETVEEVLKEQEEEPTVILEPKMSAEPEKEEVPVSTEEEKPINEKKEVTVETEVTVPVEESTKSVENEEKPTQPETSVVQPTSEKPKPEQTPQQKAESLTQAATIATTPVITSEGTAVTLSPATPNTEMPQEKPAKKSHFLIVLIILFILGIILGGGLWFAYSQHIITLPSQITSYLPKTTVPTKAIPTEAPTPTPTVDLTKYTISVLNGSGVAGEAAKVKTSLTDAGFKVDTAGNAVTSDYKETFITAKDTVDAAFLAQLSQELQKTYIVSKSIGKLTSPDSADVIVTIGSSTQ